MANNDPLTEQEVRRLILTFWRLDEEKAHLVDLMEVTAPDLEISMGQFFDERFEPKSISVEVSGTEATVKSQVGWRARPWAFPAARS